MDARPEDLSREIERLWARVGQPPAEASSSPASSSGSGAFAAAAWEALAMLKRQQRQREAAWQHAVAGRDEALSGLKARLDEARAELARLRETAAGDEAQRLEASQHVEQARQALESDAEEKRFLTETLQGLRERAAAEAARGRAEEKAWQTREQGYFDGMRELQALLDRREGELEDARSEVRAAKAEIARAKDALEQTLGQLLIERRQRQEAEREAQAAAGQAEELRGRLTELARLSDAERQPRDAPPGPRPPAAAPPPPAPRRARWLSKLFPFVDF